MSSLIRDALEEEGCVVRVAPSGLAALALAREMQPRLITLDLGLPGISGYEVANALRADATTREIPILAISAHAANMDAAFRSSLARVIAKPFYLSDVVRAVMDVLDSQNGSDGR